MATTPDIGVFLPTLADRGGVPGDVAAAARHAEALGFESAWAVDQLVAGDGAPVLDSIVALAAAAGATSRIGLAVGVLVVPLRPVVWIAKQVATLQHVSGGRLLLGVGVGGERHERSWAAAGVPRAERGRRTDAALAVLADLVAGKPVDLDGTTVELSPGAPMPPVVVGGTSPAALRRTAEHGDGWFALPVGPTELGATVAELAAAADRAARPVPAVTASTMVAIDGDPSLPDLDGLARILTDPPGRFGMPPEAVDTAVVRGGTDVVAERLRAYGEAGADRVVVTVAAGDWYRQTELLAAAAALAVA